MTQHKVQQSKRFLENTRVQDKTSESINDSLRVKLQRRFVVVKYLYPLQNVLRRSKRKIIHIFSKWKFYWGHFLNKKETYNLEKCPIVWCVLLFTLDWNAKDGVLKAFIDWLKCKGWWIKGIVIFIKNKHSSYTQIRKTASNILHQKSLKVGCNLGRRRK